MRIKKLANQIKKIRLKPVEKEDSVYFSTGSTLLNLACADKTKGAFKPGTMVNIIGDSHAGKTFLALSVLAEACYNDAFSGYDLIYDDAEAANDINIEKMFGSGLAERIISPGKAEKDEEGCDIPSSTIQDFQRHVMKSFNRERPFIYVLDSLDSITSVEEQDRFDKVAEGKEVKGSYKMEKAKALGELLRNICRKLRSTKSLLIIVSQTRQNINPMSFSPKTRSGGDALRFYAAIEMWLGLAEKHHKGVEGRKREIGVKTKVRIKKNKLTGKNRDAEFSIYYDYGIDDIGSSINFMVDEGFWTKKGEKINAKDLDILATERKLISEIERRGMERKLRKAVGRAWMEIEEKMRLGRKPKYS